MLNSVVLKTVFFIVSKTMLVLGNFPHQSITINPPPGGVSGQTFVKDILPSLSFHPSLLGEKRGKWKKMK